MASDMYVPEQLVEWKPPAKGVMKLNCDGGVSRVRGCAVGAGIFRDHQGTPLFSYASSDPGKMGHTSYQAEARALCMGLDIALRLGIHSLWIETDAKLLVDVLRSGRPNFWYEDDVIAFIRVLMTRFPEQQFILTHIYREGNMAADSLVRAMRDDASMADDIRWGRDDGLPSKVASIIDRERTGYTYIRNSCYIPRPKDCYFPPSISQI